MSNKNEWFANWFDSEYYHLLYKNRNEAEAQRFIKNLVEKLNLPKGAKVVDLACGKGRHSFELSKYGLQVKGLDLAPNSITEANNYKADNLSFGVHDMREPFGNAEYNAVFNLFTSIGYFDEPTDNRRMIEAIHQSLQPNGLLLIDFMNAHKVIKNLVAKETKTVEAVTFNITRAVENGFILKNIAFEAEGKNHQFQEKVEALHYRDFDCMLHSLFTVKAVFGDYDLNGFDIEKSSRMILLAEKVE